VALEHIEQVRPVAVNSALVIWAFTSTETNSTTVRINIFFILLYFIVNLVYEHTKLGIFLQYSVYDFYQF
jgi:hypothetical protein